MTAGVLCIESKVSGMEIINIKRKKSFKQEQVCSPWQACPLFPL
jgi:hypothetical protein